MADAAHAINAVACTQWPYRARAACHETCHLHHDHREWIVPVKGFLEAGPNKMSITIASAALEGKNRKLQHPYTIATLPQMGGFDVFK